MESHTTLWYWLTLKKQREKCLMKLIQERKLSIAILCRAILHIALAGCLMACNISYLRGVYHALKRELPMCSSFFYYFTSLHSCLLGIVDELYKFNGILADKTILLWYCILIAALPTSRGTLPPLSAIHGWGRISFVWDIEKSHLYYFVNRKSNLFSVPV